MSIVTSDVLQALRDHTNNGVNVEFTKIDGSIRKMLCTLSTHLIPVSALPKEKVIDPDAPIKEIDHEPTACRVFDLDKQAWRSFRWDSVLTFSVSE